MSRATKASNPKDAIAGKKLTLGLSPDSAGVHLALAFTEGALKYGRFNWRIAGVRASVYNAALERHRKKWWNGQNRDPQTRVHHLANAMACCAILLDAELYGLLTDDRPPCPDPDAMARLIDESSEVVAHLQAMFADHNPRQFTIADTAKQKVSASPSRASRTPIRAASQRRGARKPRSASARGNRQESSRAR